MVHSSTGSGSANEAILATLLAGTWYVRIEAREEGNNAFVFRYGVGDADPEEVARLSDAAPLVVQEQAEQRAPAFARDDYAFALAENADGSGQRLSLGTVSATDPDGDVLGYSLVAGNAAGLFEIDAGTGELFYTGAGEDYEAGVTRFDLTVRASDEALTAETTVTVEVTDVPEQEAVLVPAPELQTAQQGVVQSVSEPAGEDLPETTATTGVVAVDGSATGDIGLRGDIDWFRVTLEAATAYRIDLEGADTNRGTLDDPYLRGICDLNGNLLSGTTDDDGGTGHRNSRIVFTPDSGGTYYVAAGAFRDYTGTYEHSVVEEGM